MVTSCSVFTVASIIRLSDTRIFVPFYSFRGQVTPDNEFPLPYWRVLTVKLAFVLLFEVTLYCVLILSRALINLM